jgi:hypothetical protein
MKQWWREPAHIIQISGIFIGVIVAVIYGCQLGQMIKANKLTGEAFETDARPYIVVDNVWKANKPDKDTPDKDTRDAKITPFAPYADTPHPIVVKLFYTVTGHTPAIGVRRRIRVLSEDTPSRAKETIESLPTECPNPRDSNPPMSTGTHVWNDPSEEDVFAPEQIKRMLNDEIAMYVYGAIEYRDLFGKCHVTRFCFTEPVTKSCAPEGCFENCTWGNWIDKTGDVPTASN